jgi:putative flippase GtrA
MCNGYTGLLTEVREAITRVRTIMSQRVFRFIVVGIINTLINFAILNLSFYVFNQSRITSNLIATSIALIISFILNRSFVFSHKGRWVRQFVLFGVVTAVGTILINNTIYIISLSLLSHPASVLSRSASQYGLALRPSFIQINASAVVASVFGMAWNYTGYRIIVFREVQNGQPTES